MARKLFVVAGHGGFDKGASGVDGNIEANLTIEFRDLVLAELKKLGVIALTDSNNNALIQTLAWLKSLVTPSSIAVDIHWNASSNPDAKGTEIIIPEDPSKFEVALATDLLKMFTDVGFRNRGVKLESQTARRRLGWMRPVAENILIEVCFITNKQDMVLYNNSKHTLARRVATVLKHYVNEKIWQN